MLRFWFSSEHHTQGYFSNNEVKLYCDSCCSVTLASHPQSEGNQHCRHRGRWRQAVAEDGGNAQEDCDYDAALVSDD